MIINKYFTKNPYALDNKWIVGPRTFFLHSLATAIADPLEMIRRWDRTDYTRAGINGFIGPEAAYITAPCLEVKGKVKRMPHAGVRATNDTTIGFEMCEPDCLVYNQNHTAFTVPAGKLEAAREYVRKVYRQAVLLFAELCLFHGMDPLADGVILSHKEGWARGIASNHGDPEHLWKGLGLPFTMDTFRADVAARCYDLEEVEMTREEVRKLIEEEVEAMTQEALEEFTKHANSYIEKLGDLYQQTMESGIAAAGEAAKEVVDLRLGQQIEHVQDIPWDSVKKEMRELLDVGAIDGGTDYNVDPDDIRLPLNLVRVIVVAKRYTDRCAAK